MIAKRRFALTFGMFLLVALYSEPSPAAARGVGCYACVNPTLCSNQTQLDLACYAEQCGDAKECSGEQGECEIIVDEMVKCAPLR